ncbi:MAG TPA: hypothetical protein VEL76_36880 [Gemmataceae bacterium]|nr:hypothetical protein [Gemmataceae bacterium]
MPRELSDLKVGEQWAYRQKQTEKATCVEVVRLGTTRPPRVLIKFVDDAYEGRQEWVPPARLKVRWADVEEWQRNEDRWKALRDASDYIRDTAEGNALSMVFDGLDNWDLASSLYNNDTGILMIRDVDALIAELDLDVDFVTGDHASFVDDVGRLAIPWRVTRVIVERLARKYADTLLPKIEADEQEAQKENRWGYVSSSGTFISPEICAKADAEYALVRELVRQWCGADAKDRYDELAALRAEVVRLGKLIERAITAVRRAGDTHEADALERELGIPLEVLRHAGESSRQRG